MAAQPTLQAGGHQLVQMSLGSTAQEIDATPGEGWHPIFNEKPFYAEPAPGSTGRESTDELPAECWLKPWG